VARNLALNSASEASVQKEQTWHHPGGKLVELGPHTLKQDELLAIVIGSGVAGRSALVIANSILDEYVGLYGIHKQATIADLAKIPGLGRRKASRILAAIELGRRLYKINRPPKVAPKAEEDLFSALRPPPPVRQPELQPQGPSDADLLAEIIGSGIRGRPPKVIAQDLLSRFGSFLGLFGQDLGEFLRVKGLNSVKVIRIAAALEIAKRIAHAIS
jgi:DNA repair protein RadC